MVLQKMVTKFFGIFECLLTQNLTNQDSKLLIPQDHMADYYKIQTQGALWNYFYLKMISKLAQQ